MSFPNFSNPMPRIAEQSSHHSFAAKVVKSRVMHFR